MFFFYCSYAFLGAVVCVCVFRYRCVWFWGRRHRAAKQADTEPGPGRQGARQPSCHGGSQAPRRPGRHPPPQPPCSRGLVPWGPGYRAVWAMHSHISPRRRNQRRPPPTKIGHTVCVRSRKDFLEAGIHCIHVCAQMPDTFALMPEPAVTANRIYTSSCMILGWLRHPSYQPPQPKYNSLEKSDCQQVRG